MSQIVDLSAHHPITTRTASRQRAVDLAQRILELLDAAEAPLYDRVAALEIAQTLHALPRQPIAPRPVTWPPSGV